jgi:uncharacterized protein (DUF1499 family)
MRVVGTVLQIVFFLALIFASLLAAGVIANGLPLSDPPGVTTRLSTYLNTNVAETKEDSPFPELRLRRYEAPPALLFDVTRRAVQSLRWDVTGTDDAKKEIQAVVTTKLWGFKDDVTIQIRPGAKPTESFLWIRSASRVGKGDLGANTRHVMDLVHLVDETVPQQALVPQK